MSRLSKTSLQVRALFSVILVTVVQAQGETELAAVNPLCFNKSTKFTGQRTGNEFSDETLLADVMKTDYRISGFQACYDRPKS